MSSGQEEWDEIQPRIEAATDPQYRKRFLAEAERLAASGGEFTSETITSIIGQPESSGSVGALMTAAVKMLGLRRAGDTKAQRPNQHATRISRWCGAREQ